MTCDPIDQDEFTQILQDAVVSKRCGDCSTDTIMNSAYARYVPGPLLSCRHCRTPGLPRT